MQEYADAASVSIRAFDTRHRFLMLPRLIFPRAVAIASPLAPHRLLDGLRPGKGALVIAVFRASCMICSLFAQFVLLLMPHTPLTRDSRPADRGLGLRMAVLLITVLLVLFMETHLVHGFDGPDCFISPLHSPSTRSTVD